MTGGGFIAHANWNGRGRGWWKNSSIGVELIHHGDWRCLHTSAVGFVLGMYHWSGREVTKLLWWYYIQEEFIASRFKKDLLLKAPLEWSLEYLLFLVTRLFSYLLLYNHNLSTIKYLLSCSKFAYIRCCHCQPCLSINLTSVVDFPHPCIRPCQLQTFPLLAMMILLSFPCEHFCLCDLSFTTKLWWLGKQENTSSPV